MKKALWFLLSFGVVLLDQLSKYTAMKFLVAYQPLPVLPFFNLTLAYNRGAAFSFLSTAGEWHWWFFVIFGFLMSVGLTIGLIRTKKPLQQVAFGLILGGALGNLIDRIVFGSVVDFLDVYYKTHHWPVFNLADSAICIGAFLLFVDLRKNEKDL